MLSIDLKGRTALVVGGSRGIGASISEHLCKAGAFTVFTHTGNPAHTARVDALVEAIHAEAGVARGEAVDARSGRDMRDLVDRIAAERGSLDIIVCNAGMNRERRADMETDAEWDDAIALNLGTAWHGVRAALPHMLAKGYGRIILIGSSAVHDGGGGAMDYAAAKAGLSGMMAYLCRNYLKKGVITNIVHPCVIETDLLKERYPDGQAKAKLAAQIPVGRLGKPSDVAGLVAFLSSPWGDFICGQEVLADGGRTFFAR